MTPIANSVLTPSQSEEVDSSVGLMLKNFWEESDDEGKTTKYNQSIDSSISKIISERNFFTNSCQLIKYLSCNDEQESLVAQPALANWCLIWLLDCLTHLTIIFLFYIFIALV